MTDLVIEKNVPLPSRGIYESYHFHLMEVGDSVLVQGDTRKKTKAATAARVFGHRNDRKFKTRKVTGGVRIWRVA